MAIFQSIRLGELVALDNVSYNKLYIVYGLTFIISANEGVWVIKESSTNSSLTDRDFMSCLYWANDIALKIHEERRGVR